MTAGTRRNSTRRNSTSKFGPFKRAARRFGGPEGQAQDEYGGLLNDGTGTYAEDSSYGYEEPAIQAGHAGDAGQADPEAELSRNAGHYTGRHVGPRGKTTRKRVGRVVPVVAVAATLAAAGTAAAYALGSGGQPQAANLNAAMSSLPGTVTHSAGSGAGNANASAYGLIKIAKANARSAARAAAKPAAKARPRRKPTAAPSAAATHVAAAIAPAATTQAAAPAATAAASSVATKTQAAATTLSCNLSNGMLPDNVTAIVSFLLAHGYSDNAAAGIAGNMYQESKGNPESVGDGGGGLIGFTPLPSGYVTGNATADLQTQLSAVLTYNQGWASFLPALNAAASPSAAADIYVTDFERAGIPAASTREASAQDVASACGI